MTKSVIDWVPRLNPLLRVGPPRWNGTAIVTDIGIDGEERLIEIGLAERCVLDEVDGSRDVSTIASELSAKGMPVDTTRIVGVLNRFAYVGAVERPFSMKAGLAARPDSGCRRFGGGSWPVAQADVLGPSSRFWDLGCRRNCRCCVPRY